MRRREHPARRGARRRLWWAAAFVVLVALASVAWSVGAALTAPGTDSVAARLAEWGRNHGLGVLVLDLEKLQYRLHPPATGGAPPAGVLHPQPGLTRAAPLGRRPPRSPAASLVRMRLPLRTLASPALPGEGTWRVLARVHRQPAVQAAFLRPDRLHTSYLTGVVWMSSRLLRFVLHPGFDQPGGSWPVPDWIPPRARHGLVATWNGAFKLADARGGFYLDHRTAGRLVRGAASEAFYRNGTMTVGSWDREVHMSRAVVGVRQNLTLLIDHGRIARNVNTSPFFHWGLTVGGAYYVFRSGVGVTRQGDVVYASGNALSVQSLARILARAGCVRAMELDINPAWVSFMSYGPASHQPTSLLPDYQRPPNRYFQPTSRDFVAAYAREAGAPAPH
jgi:hypothetical protein